MNLGVIVLYAPRDHACEITEKVIGLYLKIVENLDLKMEHCLYSVIYLMIDAYFDDEYEFRRLTEMIKEKTSDESKQLFASHENTMESLKYAQEDLAKANGEISDLKAEVKRLNEELNSK